MLFCFKKWRNEGLNMTNPGVWKNKHFTVNSYLNNPYGNVSELVVYTDGSCNKLNTKAGIGIHFENKNDFPN